MARKKVRLTNEEKNSISAPLASPDSNNSPATLEPAVQAFAERSDISGSASGRRASARARLSVPLKDDGTPDLAACRSEQLTQLRALLTDPKVREELGVAGIPPEMIFTEQDISMLLDLMGGIEGQVFMWLGKVDSDIAMKYAMWQPQEKALVMKPAQAVLAKNAASLAWFLRWRDEIALGLLMVTITRAKYQGAKIEMQLRRDGQIPDPRAQAAPAPAKSSANGQEFVAESEKPVQ